MRVLHFADNNVNPTKDPYHKVRPLFDQLNKESPKYIKNVQNYSVDESMVPYFGHHHTKQFIRLKPIRYLFEIFLDYFSYGNFENKCSNITHSAE